jgi:hypothetical protein
VILSLTRCNFDLAACDAYLVHEDGLRVRVGLTRKSSTPSDYEVDAIMENLAPCSGRPEDDHFLFYRLPEGRMKAVIETSHDPVMESKFFRVGGGSRIHLDLGCGNI